MAAQIRPTRLEVTDRFPMLGFTIRTDGTPTRAEVVIATDPDLFRPDHKDARNAANFFSSRGHGAVSVPRGEAIYIVPPEVLVRFIGQDRVYAALAVTPERTGATPQVAVIPETGSPYISLRGLTGRSLKRVRLVPSRQQIASGYGPDAGASLTWAGDTPVPGTEPARNGMTPPAARSGNGANGAGTVAPDKPIEYDDGFGPMKAKKSNGAAGAPSLAPVAATPTTAPAPVATVPAPATASALGLDDLVVSGERVPVTPPSVKRLESWQIALAEGAMAVLSGPLGPVISALPAAARAGNVSIGVGPAVSAGLGGGAGLGAGVVFGPDGGIGVYGAAEFDAGFLASISAQMQVTVVRGGIESFNGWGLAATISGGEGVVGGASALFDLAGNFQGVSFQLGVGAGLTPVDFYIAVQRQVATALAMAQAQSVRATARKPKTFALTIDSEDVQNAQKYGPGWLDLVRYRVPEAVNSMLGGRDIQVQKIEDASGDLNIDRYDVRVDTLPTIDGAQLDAPGLLQRIRLNLNDFVDSTYATFSPYVPGTDDAMWASGSIGAVYKIDMLGPDNASVVASIIEDSRWRFSTVHAPDTGDHPVSGHREFGFRNGDQGELLFYTRGADRTTGFPETLAEPAVFAAQDRLWKSFQRKVADFVNANGGSATVVDPFVKHINWAAFNILLSPQGSSLAVIRALDAAQSFTLNWDDVEPIPQPSDFSCWAAAAAMVVGWRDQVSLSPETIGSICGRTTATGLDPAQVGQFAAEIGLTPEPPQCYTVDGFRQLLESSGPLWVGAAVPGLHAIVVTGFYGDGTNNFVRITDPWDRTVGTPGAPGPYLQTHATGSRYIMKWEDFVAEYESAATDFSQVNLQILHADGTGGRSPNRGKPAAYAQSLAKPAARKPAAKTRTASARAGAKALADGDGDADDQLNLAPPPAPRARAMGAGADAATAIGSVILDHIISNEGDVSWELDQMRGLKHPNDQAPPSPQRFQDAKTIKLTGWPVAGGLVDNITADFTVDWQYNGLSLGNVAIENVGVNDAVGWGLKVQAHIMDDNKLYAPNSCAALRVRFHYRFTRSIGTDVIAITELHLYGDGTWEQNSRWEQADAI